MEDDTIKLLRECNAGIKMGISSLDDVMEHVKDSTLENLLKKSKETHCKLGDKTHDYLREYHDEAGRSGFRQGGGRSDYGRL